MIRNVTISFLLLVTCLFFTINYTDPSMSGPAGILVVFVLIYLLFLIVTSQLLLFGVRLAKKIRTHYGFSSITSAFSTYNSYVYGSVVSLGLVVLLGRNTLGPIGLFELILIITFVVIGCFFVSKQVVK